MDFDEKWTMHGADEGDPSRIKTCDELISYIHSVGFLPLFRNTAEGFSVEERVSAKYWWTDDEQLDPWCWRMKIAACGSVAYGKFFAGSAGFVAKEWFPYFASVRRDGYDFDARMDEGLVKRDDIRVMTLLNKTNKIDSRELRIRSKLGKRLDATLMRLMMSSYLVINDFTQKINKSGQPYGWHMAVYTTPETLWGDEFVKEAYNLGYEACANIIRGKLKMSFPSLDQKLLRDIVLNLKT